MTKKIPMTRERKIALPVILDAAEAYVARMVGHNASHPMVAATKKALEVFGR